MMEKWADYLISGARYGKNHLLEAAVRHADSGDGISGGEPVDRMAISSDIKRGLTYSTIYSGKGSWKRGAQIRVFSVGGQPYLRTDQNKAMMDNLGDLPETDLNPPKAR